MSNIAEFEKSRSELAQLIKDAGDVVKSHRIYKLAGVMHGAIEEFVILGDESKWTSLRDVTQSLTSAFSELSAFRFDGRLDNEINVFSSQVHYACEPVSNYALFAMSDWSE